jgi:hypothetical protein
MLRSDPAMPVDFFEPMHGAAILERAHFQDFPGDSRHRMSIGWRGIELLSLVSCERIFRWWRSAVCLFRRRFLVRGDRGARCDAFPGRFAFSSTCMPSSRSPLRRRAIFDTRPALSSGASLGCGAPFGSCAAFRWRPLSPGRARGRRTFLTLRHMLPPVRTGSVSMKLYFSLCRPQRRTQRKHHGFRLCFSLIVRLGGEPRGTISMAKRVRPC